MERRDYHAPVAKPLTVELGPPSVTSPKNSPPLSTSPLTGSRRMPQRALWIALVLRAHADCDHVLAARAQIRRRARDGRVVDFDRVLLEDAAYHSLANKTSAPLDRAGKRARRQFERDGALRLQHEWLEAS